MNLPPKSPQDVTCVEELHLWLEFFMHHDAQARMAMEQAFLRYYEKRVEAERVKDSTESK